MPDDRELDVQIGQSLGLPPAWAWEARPLGQVGGDPVIIGPTEEYVRRRAEEWVIPLTVVKHEVWPPYSERWDCMRHVVEAMHARGWWCDMASPFSKAPLEDDDTSHLFSAGFWPSETIKSREGVAFADSLPRAVCLAAMKVLGEEGDLEEAE